ncbi:MAG: hypothetical protein J0M04_17275 [Verrucomicrobia bacterium]|nr:hypothetical protein [Verrucomicrobiota bacterium]
MKLRSCLPSFLVAPRIWSLAFAMVCGSARAEILIDDLTTLTISGTVTAADDYDTDWQSTIGGGTLEIAAGGKLIFSDGRTVSETFGGGFLSVAGTLEHDAASPSYVHAGVITSGSAEIRALQSGLYLMGGGSYAGNPEFHADGGDIWFAGGTHSIGNATLTGGGNIRAYSGILALTGAINGTAGPVTGGLVVQGGTIRGSGGGMGGITSRSVSADRVVLGTGSLESAMIRVTGTGSTPLGSMFDLVGGVVINEGVFSQSATGFLNADPAGSAGSGTIINKGTWNLMETASVFNLEGDGEFQNLGLLRTLDAAGNAVVRAKMRNESGATIRAAAGSVLSLNGGGVYDSGSVFDCQGTVSLGNGSHVMGDCVLSGGGYLQSFLFSNISLLGNMGPASGPATGGFMLVGGAVTGLSGGLGGGGSGTDMFSAERGVLAAGTVSATTLRFTGLSEIAEDANVGLISGALINEGTFWHRDGGVIDTDPEIGSGIYGTIVNKGVWNMEGDHTIANTNGEGVFINEGTIQTTGPASYARIGAEMHHGGGAVMHAITGSTIVCEGGGTYLSDGVLRADGTIALGGGLHTVFTHAFEGDGYVGTLGSDCQWQVGVVGPLTGPATGGFEMNGGMVSHFPLGGASAVNVERGRFASGTIDGVKVRVTGTSVKQSNSYLLIRSGMLVNEGVMTHQGNSGFDLDPELNFEVYGKIENRGTWNVLGDCDIRGLFSQGIFENHGLVDALTDAAEISIGTEMLNMSTGILRARSGGSISLIGRSTHQPGSVLDADGGGISFVAGDHLLDGPTLTGGSSVKASGGSVWVIDRVGPESGPATGGFSMEGGTVGGAYDNGSGVVMAGPGAGWLAADHGTLATGEINDANLRYTGMVQRSGTGGFSIRKGSLRVDGVMTQSPGSHIQLDPDTAEDKFGAVENLGEWNALGACRFDNLGGGGKFLNSGLFNAAAGTVEVMAGLENRDGGRLSATGGAIQLKGGSLHESGSVMDASAAQSVSLVSGVHTFDGGSLVGQGWIYAQGGSTVLNGSVGPVSGAAQGGFGLTGGTVSGTGLLSAARGYYSTGTITGNPTLRFTESFAIEANKTLSLASGTIRNEGSFVQGTGVGIALDPSSAAGGGTLVNRGTWQLGTGTTYSNTYGEGVFENGGLFHSSGGNNTIQALFRQTAGGVLRVTAGQMVLSGGSEIAAGSVLEPDGGALYLSTGSHVLAGGSLAGSSLVYASGGTTTVSGDVGNPTGNATGGFGMTGGTVTGTGTLSADRGYFSTGLIGGAVTLRLTGESTKAGATTLNMNGGTILNDGAWTNAASGTINLDSTTGGGSGSIINRGTWRLNGAVSYNNIYDGGQVVNHGLFECVSGNSSIDAAVHHRTGSVFRVLAGQMLLSGGGSMEVGAALDAAGGIIYLNAGTHTWTGGTIIGNSYVYCNNTGYVTASGEIGAASGPATGGFGVTGGTLTGTGTVSADHGYFSAGLIGGSVTVRLTGNSSTAGVGNTLNMNGGTILNEGVWTHAASGTINLDSASGGGAGMIVNQGTWRLNGAVSYNNSNGAGQVVNHGVFECVSGNSSIAGAVHHRTGSMFRVLGGQMLLSGGGSLEAGATLDAKGGIIYLSGGTHTWTGGTIIGNDHVYCSGGTTTVSGEVGAASGPATGGFGVTGGTLTGTGTVSADHGYFSTGLIGGSVTVRLTGNSSTAGTGNTLNMNGGTILNEGVWTHAASGTINLDSTTGGSAGTITNHGTWRLNGAVGYNNTYGGGQVVNHGLFECVSGNSSIDAVVHHRTGSVFRVLAGQMLLTGGGSLEAGATLDAAGGIIYLNDGTHTWTGGTLTGNSYVYCNNTSYTTVSGEVGAASGPATGGFGVTGGTLTGTGTVSADHGYFSTGQIGGSVTVRLTGAASKAASTTLNMSGGTIRNEGVFTHQTSGTINLDNSTGAGGGTIHNLGTWNIAGAVSFNNTNNGGAFLNSGILTVATGSSTISAAMTNSGSIQVNGGTLSLSKGSSHTGTILANGGITFGAGTHTMSGTSAYLGGSGSSTGTLALSNGASIRPGNSAGNFTNYGTLSFTAGGANPSVVVELASASSFDTITLANSSVLALGSGLTDLTVQPLYHPVPGTVYRIITAGTGTGVRTGTFRNAPATGSLISGTSGTITAWFRVTYDGAGKYVELTALDPYDAWAESKGLTGGDAGFNADPDGDGIPNGIEFVIGGEPNPANPAWDSRALLPTMVLDETYLRFVFRRSQVSATYLPTCHYSGDLTAWTLAEDDTNGVDILETPNGFSPGIDRVEVLIPRALATSGRLFARLQVEDSP